MAAGQQGEEGSARWAVGLEASRQTMAVTHREAELGLQNPQLVVDHEQAVRRQECGFRTAAVGRPMKMTFRIELDDDTSVAVLLHQVCMQSLDRLRAGGRKRERGGEGGE